jgi:hypothetical protein
MQLECLILREGPTTVILEGVKYMFMPIPGTKKGEMSTSVCEVQTERHLEYLMKTNQYREYNQDQAISEADARRKEKHPYEGISIEKYGDTGYVLINKKNPKAPYGGPDGWRKEKTGSCFKSESEAWDFLKEEVAAAKCGE